jgi:hypothetical protein
MASLTPPPPDIQANPTASAPIVQSGHAEYESINWSYQSTQHTYTSQQASYADDYADDTTSTLAWTDGTDSYSEHVNNASHATFHQPSDLPEQSNPDPTTEQINSDPTTEQIQPFLSEQIELTDSTGDPIENYPSFLHADLVRLIGAYFQLRHPSQTMSEVLANNPQLRDFLFKVTEEYNQTIRDHMRLAAATASQ